MVGVMARSRLLVSARDVYWLNRLWYFACGVFSLVRLFLSAMDVKSLSRNQAETTEVRQNVKVRRLEGPPPQPALEDASGKTAASWESSVSSPSWPLGPPPQLVIKDAPETTEVQENVQRLCPDGPPPQLELKDSPGDIAASSESRPGGPPPQLDLMDASGEIAASPESRPGGPPPQLPIEEVRPCS